MKALESHYAWHQEFWLRNNLRFEEERSKYAKSMDIPLTDDQMAQFYRRYLKAHHEEFTQYHIDCWKRNIRLMTSSYRFCWYILTQYLRKKLPSFSFAVK